MILYRRNVNGTLIHQLHNCLKCDRDCLASIPSPSPGCECIELQGHLSWTHLLLGSSPIKHISAYVLGYCIFILGCLNIIFYFKLSSFVLLKLNPGSEQEPWIQAVPCDQSVIFLLERRHDWQHKPDKCRRFPVFR